MHPFAFAAFNLVFLFVVFRPLEVHFPAKLSQRFFRPQWFLDLCFYWGQIVIWNGLVFWCLWKFRDSFDWIVPASFRASVAAQPWWLQAVEVVILSDFTIYWGHRLQHCVGILWRFHAVHHSCEHLDWLAAGREHPLDTIYTVCLVNLPMFALGFPIPTITGLIVFRGIWAVFIHTNVRLPLGPFGMLLGSPALHHWHHDRDRDAGNYGNLSPIMDLLFGTHHCPEYEPVCLGLKEPTPTTYLGHMLQPFLPRRRAKAKPPVTEADSEQPHLAASGSTAGGQSGTSISPRSFTT
ncbi:MAG: sterol desaturase family protein [Planctomycetes bacterium]|nr:sterol desaturase family protein [Planctomycetota bacterium]